MHLWEIDGHQQSDMNTLIRSIIFHIEEHHKNSGQNHSMMTICYYWMTCCDGRFEMGNALSGIGIGMWTCDGWWIRAKILMSGAMWQILRNAKRGCSFRSLAHHVKRRKVRFFCFVFFWYFFFFFDCCCSQNVCCLWHSSVVLDLVMKIVCCLFIDKGTSPFV